LCIFLRDMSLSSYVENYFFSLFVNYITIWYKKNLNPHKSTYNYNALTIFLQYIKYYFILILIMPVYYLIPVYSVISILMSISFHLSEHFQQ
jgi:hypothetical protein